MGYYLRTDKDMCSIIHTIQLFFELVPHTLAKEIAIRSTSSNYFSEIYLQNYLTSLCNVNSYLNKN